MTSSNDRRALQSVAAQFFVNGAVVASFVPRLPEIRDTIGVSLATLGLILTIGGAMGITGSFAVSPTIERFGTRRVIIVGGLLLVSCLSVIGLATHPLVLIAALAGISTFDVMVDVSMNMQGSWLSARRPKPVMNRLHGVWSLGTVTGGLVSSRLAAAGVSPRSHLLGATVILLLTLVFIGRGLLTADEAAVGGDHDDARAPDGGRSRRRATRRGLVLFALAGGTAVAMEMTSSDWAAFRLTDDFGAAAGFAGLAYVANTGGMTVSRLSGDAIEARIGNEALLRLAIAVTAIGLSLASFGPTRLITLTGYGLTGIGMAPFMPRLYDDAVKLPGKPGAGVGALTAGIRVTVLITPVAVGALAASGLSVGQATAVVTLPAIAAFTLLTQRRR